MKDLQIFESNQFGQLRGHVDENNHPWFCAKDISDSLEYSDGSNPSRLFAAVPEEWKGVKPIHTPGGTQEMLCLTEQGLYFFLGRSDKPKALPYQKWVAGEIMPSIRQTGRYEAPKTNPRRASDEVTARSVATSYRMLARMKEVYPAEMLAVFAAKSVSALTGEPVQPLLPPVRDSRDAWMSPTMLAEYFGVSRNVVGRTLKSLNLHGENDPDHRHSQPLWDKSPYSNKEVLSYIYDPEVVIPALAAAFNPPRETAQ